VLLSVAHRQNNVGVQNAALLKFPPGEALADLALGAQPAKRNVGSPFRLALRSRETMLRGLVPKKCLARFDPTAQLA
jgi:hypothetical protein